MKSTAILKDFQFRRNFLKFENYARIKKFLFTNLLNNPKRKSLRGKVVFFFLKKKSSKFSKAGLKNKCVLTGRNRSVDKKYSLSRIVFRRMLQFGVIPGYRKAVW